MPPIPSPARAATTLYLIRHGATAWNAATRWAGQAEMPMSDLGQAQIARLAARLAAEPAPFARIYTSPLGRAQESAAIVDAALRVGVAIDVRLLELSYGEWEGKTAAEVRATPEGAAWHDRWVASPATVRTPGGEEAAEALARGLTCLHELAARHPGQRLVACGHRSINRILLAHALGLPLDEYRRAVPQDNGALNVLVVEPDRTLRALLVNDTAHLAGFPRGEGD
jgi:probable phosphoglycerate mutase